MKKMSCKQLRNVLMSEWPRFLNYTVEDVKKYIRYNFVCSWYTVNKLAHEFAGK